VSLHGAALPLAAAVRSDRRHLALSVLQVHRPFNSVPVGGAQVGSGGQSCVTTHRASVGRRGLVLGDEHQHAVVSDGVDDGVGHTAPVRLGVSVLEVEALEQLGGRLLGPLGRLGVRGQRSESMRGRGRRTRRGTDPVLVVDVPGRLLQVPVAGRRPAGVGPPVRGDGGGEEAVHQDVGVAADGRGEVGVAVQSQS